MGIFRKKSAVGSTPESAAPVTVDVVEKRVSKNASFASSILFAPLATEKAAMLVERNVYAFFVAPTVTAIAVRQAIRDRYGVTPIKVTTMRLRGKTKRFRGHVGSRSDRKKALVFLPSGTRLELFPKV